LIILVSLYLLTESHLFSDVRLLDI